MNISNKNLRDLYNLRDFFNHYISIPFIRINGIDSIFASLYK